ncbi:MAG: tetratricopeptide repeat protein [Desulfobacterales bacterium]|nr:MAG: tetratricopeptide repeat protein [Desulfobacterales bacterium]
MSKLQAAIKYSLEGPLHKAIALLQEVLQSNPGEKKAALYLADVYSRLGRYEDALSLFSQIRASGHWDREIEKERRRITQVWQNLKTVEKSRFQKQTFLSHAIVPDGKGGYFVDTLGFPGTWGVCIGNLDALPPGAYLRFLKSLAWVTQEIRTGKIKAAGSGPAQEFPLAGRVHVTQDKAAKDILISLVDLGEGKRQWRVTVKNHVLYWEREQQRKEIQAMIKRGELEVGQTQNELCGGELPQTNPGLVLISLGLASDYAITVLQDRLRDQGVSAFASFIRSLKHLGDYLNDYADLPELDHRSPAIFAISVFDTVIPKVCWLIALLRQRFPDAFIIVGGSTSQTPEQFAALIADFDILIRGDGDEILPRIAKIIGKKNKGAGLSEIQLEALRALPGGLIIQQKNRRIVHRLDYTNIPARYHLPRPRKKATIYYWQTSRGCPYDCRFCYKWSGKRYQMVVPWENDPVDLTPAQRSAMAMKEFLLARLALEWPEGIALKELEKLLKTAKARGRPVTFAALREKIFIVIEDDDFLINRERVREFYTLVDELGLQEYFVFSAITSVRTLYRERNNVDREILQWLKDSNFTALDLGSDGLCQATIDENQKGYSLDRHVIPLNALLKEMGFFAFNNTIITTPYTTIPQFIESLIFYILCPYPINTAIEIGIMGHIGTKYTNEDIANQQYDWREQDGEIRGHFRQEDNYMIPVNFPEYALNGSHMISYADPKVRDLILKFPEQEPIKFIVDDIPKEEVDKVLNAWINASDAQPEIKAIGKSIALLQRRHPQWEYDYTILTIKEEMSMLGLSSFVEYYARLQRNEIENDPQFRWIMKKRWKAGTLKKEQKPADAEKELKGLVQEAPGYFRAHHELIVLLGNQGKISAAVEYFSRYQVIHPDLRFYHMFFHQLMKALNLDEAIKNQRAFFHIPRYYTLSPIYYFLARLKELAGGPTVKEFAFGRFSPRGVEDLYDLFDFLTVDTIKAVIAECSVDLADALRKGRELNIMGIPVRLVTNGQQLILDYGRVNKDAALTIEENGGAD